MRLKMKRKLMIRKEVERVKEEVKSVEDEQREKLIRDQEDWDRERKRISQ